MSNQNYIIEMLELKDNNINFYKNCYYKEEIKGITHKVFEGYLSYQPEYCDKCGILFDEHFEKHGFIWGGKWIIWDNMHFEYRPEVVIYNRKK